jgi:branched-chain amino acid transport system permease protein
VVRDGLHQEAPVIADIVNGIAFGAVLFVLASGFSLALGVIRIVNIAHGAFYMLAVYIGISVQKSAGFIPALLVGGLSIMVLAAVVQRLILSRFDLDPLPQVLSTFGLTIAIAEATRLIWGGYPETLPTPAHLTGSTALGSISITNYRLFLIAVAVVLALALWYLVERTRIGAIVRAAVDDEEMARSMGVNVEWLFVGVFAFSGLLAGFAGVLGGPILGTYQGVQFEVLTLTLVVVVLGGMGSLAGAFVGSMAVGILNSVGLGLLPQYSYFVLFAPMILILTVRPRGLLGRPVHGEV